MNLNTILAVLLVTGSAAEGASRTLRVPFFDQQENGCGAASSAMVMHYWSDFTSHQRVYPSADEAYQRLYKPERKGILLVDMKRFFEENGFQAYTLRGQRADLEQQLSKGRPVIVALKKGSKSPMHYVVVTGVTPEAITVNDPTRKANMRLKWAVFDSQWEGGDRWMLLASPTAAP